MPNPNYVPVWRGWIQIQATATNGTPAVGTTYMLPGVALPTNGRNIVSPDVIDFSGFETVEVAGKWTPSIRVISYAKPTWFLSGFLNGLITSLNSNFGTNTFAVGLYNTFRTRVFDGCKCMLILIEQAAIGGPIKVTLDFLAIYGDNQAPTPTSFSAPAIDPGQLHNVSAVGFAGTADMVNAFTLAIMRRQRYIPRDNGTLFMDDIASGKLGGTFALDQSPSYNTSPGLGSFGAATVRIGSAGSGVQFSMLLSSNGDNEPHTTDEGTVVRAYSMRDVNTGLNPVVMSSF